MKVAVLGAGSWGTALAALLARNGHPTTVWGRNAGQVEAINTLHENTRYLPGIVLPENLQASTDLPATVRDADFILVVTPSHAFTETVQALAPHRKAGVGVSWATKGFEPGSGRFLHEVAGDILGADVTLAVVTGPSFAKEVTQGLPTAVTVHSEDPDFAQTVATILHDSGLEPSGLELEITETVLARDSRQCIETLQALKALHLEIAIDDFGTGYSSLNYLKRFPVDTIKIDRSFVVECDVNSEDAAICSAIILLARSLGLKTLAEGVEKPGQLAFLRAEGCFAYQGYLFSQPLPAAAMAELLAHGEASA